MFIMFSALVLLIELFIARLTTTNTVVNKHQTAHPKVMAQWASHGDLDMDKKQVWEKYIDNDKYDKLRRIKREVDPDDVFHARFTIRPEVSPVE